MLGRHFLCVNYIVSIFLEDAKLFAIFSRPLYNAQPTLKANSVFISVGCSLLRFVFSVKCASQFHNHQTQCNLKCLSIYYTSRPLQNADLELENYRQNIFPSPSLNIEGKKKEKQEFSDLTYIFVSEKNICKWCM